MTGLVRIYTDGACRGNPGPGGWGAILCFEEREKELLGFEANTTNNRMEMTAVIAALKALRRGCQVLVTTDSKYVADGVSQWLPNWKRRGWRTSGNRPVKNQDLWQELDALLADHDVRWEWVRGHRGHAENERADALANRAIDESSGNREGLSA